MKKFLALCIVSVVLSLTLAGCEAGEEQIREDRRLSNTQVEKAREVAGYPNITKFTEYKLAKEISEKRDDPNLICYAYVYNNMSGKFAYLGQSIGFGLPYSTQITAPDQNVSGSSGAVIKQADPNALYSADGGSTATWLQLLNEETGEIHLLYFEPQIAVYEDKLPRRLCDEDTLPADY